MFPQGPSSGKTSIATREQRRPDHGLPHGAAGAGYTMQTILDNQRCDRQDLDQLMAQGHSSLPHSLSQSDATPAGIKVVFNHIIHPLNWRQLRLPIRDGPAARRASGHWPCAALAADPLARRWRAAWRSSKSCGRSASAGWAVQSAGR